MGASTASHVEELHRQYSQRVYGYVYRRTGDVQSAQQITNDVFRIAWQHQKEPPEDALPWLLVTARNLVANELQGPTPPAQPRREARQRRTGPPSAPRRTTPVPRSARSWTPCARRNVKSSCSPTGIRWPGEIVGTPRLLPDSAKSRLFRARKAFSTQGAEPDVEGWNRQMDNIERHLRDADPRIHRDSGGPLPLDLEEPGPVFAQQPVRAAPRGRGAPGALSPWARWSPPPRWQLVIVWSPWNAPASRSRPGDPAHAKRPQPPRPPKPAHRIRPHGLSPRHCPTGCSPRTTAHILPTMQPAVPCRCPRCNSPTSTGKPAIRDSKPNPSRSSAAWTDSPPSRHRTCTATAHISVDDVAGRHAGGQVGSRQPATWVSSPMKHRRGRSGGAPGASGLAAAARLHLRNG